MNFRVLCGVLVPLLTTAVGINSLTSHAQAEDAPQTQPPTQPPAAEPDGRPDNGKPTDGEHGNGKPDAPRGEGHPDGRMGQGTGGQRPGFGPQFRARGGGYRGGEGMENRRRDLLETRLRALMSAMGFPDADVQTAIIQHIKDEEKAMTPVRGASRALMDAMRDPNASPERLTTLLNNLHVALDADKLRRKEAQLILDNKIAYSRSPRLEAMLTLLGVLDDSPSSLAVRNPTLDFGNRNFKQNLTGQIVTRVAPPLPTTTPADTVTPTAAPKADPAKEPVKDAPPQKDTAPAVPQDDKAAPAVDTPPAQNK